MIKNNLKALVYFGLWYFVLASSFIFINFRGFVSGIIPSFMGPVLFFGIATLVYSLVFALLFLRPQGNLANNFSSLGSLIALDIGVILGVALATLFLRFSYVDLVLAVAFCIAQIVLVLAVLSLKKD